MAAAAIPRTGFREASHHPLSLDAGVCTEVIRKDVHSGSMDRNAPEWSLLTASSPRTALVFNGP